MNLPVLTGPPCLVSLCYLVTALPAQPNLRHKTLLSLPPDPLCPPPHLSPPFWTVGPPVSVPVWVETAGLRGVEAPGWGVVRDQGP